MKSLVFATVAVSILAAPIASFAQSNQQPLTREEVRAELVKLEKAGYNPHGDNLTYPENIQAAQARVDAQNGTAAVAADTSGYGREVSGATQSGSFPQKSADGVGSLYRGR